MATTSRSTTVLAGPGRPAAQAARWAARRQLALSLIGKSDKQIKARADRADAPRRPPPAEADRPG